MFSDMQVYMHQLVEAMLHSNVSLIIPGRSTTRKEFAFSKTERILNALNLVYYTGVFWIHLCSACSMRRIISKLSFIPGFA